jgi:hypothetical protein
MPSRGTKYSFMRVVGRDIVDIADETWLRMNAMVLQGKARQGNAMRRNQSERGRGRGRGRGSEKREEGEGERVCEGEKMEPQGKTAC